MDDLEIEIWKDIPGYEGLYQVSTFGQVKKLNYKCSGKEHILSLSSRAKEYKLVGLSKNGIRQMVYVHRLVLSTFEPNPSMDTLEVNHKDENKTNNHLSNLEWCTRSYNNSYGSLPQKRAEIAKCNTYMLGKHHSESAKKKISMSKTGKKLSEETKKKMSEANKGEKNGFYGKHHSIELKQRISLMRNGIKLSDCTKKKLSDGIKGKKWWHDSEGNTTRSRACPGEGWFPGRSINNKNKNKVNED